MRFYVSKFIFVFAVLAFNASCSDSSSSSAKSTTVDNEITAVFSSVNSQVNKASGLSDQSSVQLANSDFNSLVAPNFDSAWTTPSMNNPLTGSGNVSPMDWMGYQLSPNARRSNGSDINIFGRVKTGLGIFCAVGVAAGVQKIELTNGYPANGTYTITFTAALKEIMSSQCGVDTSNITTGMSMTLTVASATGNYDKKYSFDAFDQVYFVKYNSSVVNIASAEDQQSGSVSRMILQWDKTANVLLAEYIHNPGDATAGTNGVYAYRMYYDEANDDGQIMTYEGDDSSASNSNRYILAGKPDTGDAFSLSMKIRDVLAHAELEACVNGSTGAIITDGSRCSATSTRTVGAAVSSLDTVFSNFFSQRTATTWFSSLTSSTTLGWSSKANMLTAAIVP